MTTVKHEQSIDSIVDFIVSDCDRPWENQRLSEQFFPRRDEVETFMLLNENIIPIERSNNCEWIGDSRCKYNARSPHLRCAVNPAGDCKNCQHFEKRL